MGEYKLYPIVENFLQTEKGCYKDYVGQELSFTDFRTDVYGVSCEGGEPIIYFLEGKKELNKRHYFSKVLLETIPLVNYADYIYVFGRKVEKFEENNEEYIEECKERGIGILLIDENDKLIEYWKPEKKNPKIIPKKEALFRIFNRTVENPIADFILQAVYEYTEKINNKCAKFIDVYNSLFSKDEYKEILNRILKGEHVLNPIGMRRAFQMVYGETYYVGIKETGKRIENQICVNEKTLEKVKPLILLDYSLNKRYEKFIGKAEDIEIIKRGKPWKN